MKKKGMVLVLALVSLCLVLACAGCGGSSSSQEDPISDGKLSVAVDDTYLPMEYRDDQNNLVGFDIDFANALGKDLGVSVDFQTVAWDGIFNGLNSKQYDAIISSTSITDERKKGFNQTDPYVANGIVLVSNKTGNQVSKFEDLEGKTLGVQIQTSADEAANKLKSEKGTNVTIKEYDAMLDAFSALEGKQIDNIMTDEAVGEYYASIKPDVFVVSSKTLTNEPIGVTVRKGDDDFTKKLNESIKHLQDNGTMAQLSNKWFKKDMTSNIDTKLNVIQ